MSFKTISTSVILALAIFGYILIANADVSHLQAAQYEQPVTEICLGCICAAISNCNRTATCIGDVCGLFRITWPYWADAGKPTVRDEPQASETAYVNCANDPYCAATAVQNYMAKFGQDCNGDGVINCYDHAAIHKLGGYGCKGDLTVSYYNKLDNCLKNNPAIDVRNSK